MPRPYSEGVQTPTKYLKPKPKPAGAAAGAKQATKPKAYSAPSAPVAPVAPTAPVTPPGLTPDEQYYFDSYLGSQGNPGRLDQQYQQSLAQLNYQRGVAGSDYDHNIGQLKDQYAKLWRTFGDQFAGRGLLNSGIYGQAITDQSSAEQNQYDDLRRQYQNMLGGYDLQQSQLGQTRTNAINDLEAQRRARLNTIQGSLGGR